MQSYTWRLFVSIYLCVFTLMPIDCLERVMKNNVGPCSNIKGVATFRISKSGCKTAILLCYRQKMRPKKVILKSSFMGNSIHKLIQSGVLDWIRYFFQRGKNNFLCLIFTPDQILKRRRRVSHALKAATFTSSQKGCVLLCNNEQLNDLF